MLTVWVALGVTLRPSYAFIYGAGDQKLGHSYIPVIDAKKQLGKSCVANSLLLSQDWSHNDAVKQGSWKRSS